MVGYKFVGFDLDSTLIRTDEQYIDSIFQLTFDDLGISGDIELKKRLWYSYRRDDVVRSVFDDVSLFWRTLHKHQKGTREFREDSISVYRIDDLRALAWLKNKRGLGLGVVTGSSAELLDISLDVLGRDKFCYVTHVYNNHRSKADGILDFIKQVKASKDEVLYVGNDDGDVIAAREAGVDCALVKRDFLDEFRYFAPKLRPDHELRSISDIVTLF